MKKVIITGVSSFIGFHLAQKLSKFYEVYGTHTKDFNDYQNIYLTRLEELKRKQINLIKFDVTNQNDIKKVVSEIKPEIWFNHAGFTKDYNNFNYDINTADKIHIDNLECIFQELAKNNCQKFIGTGTNAEYSDTLKAHQESEVCAPSTPYGKAKLKQTELSLSLGKKYKVDTAIVRVFIPYGEFDNPQKLFPALQKKLWLQEKMQLSDGSQERNFIAIDELIYLYHHLSQSHQGFEIYNGASSQNLSVKNFILDYAQKHRLPAQVLEFGALPMKEGEQPKSTADITKVNNFLKKCEQGQMALIENESEALSLNNSPLCLCSSPKAARVLEKKGIFSFSTKDYFTPSDHFELSSATNIKLKEQEEKLQKAQINSDLIFNIKFNLQFILAKELFKKHLTQKILNHTQRDLTPITTPEKNTKTQLPSFKILSLYKKIVSLLNGLSPAYQSHIITANNKNLLKFIQQKHPNDEITLFLSSGLNKISFSKLLFNFVNFLPNFIRKPIFKKLFGFTYTRVWDVSSLIDTQLFKNLSQKLHEFLPAEKLISSLTSYCAFDWVKLHLQKNKPKSGLHILNVDLSRYLMADYPSWLISHGAHALNDNNLLEEDLIRHAQGLTLSPNATIICQTSMTKDFVKKYAPQNQILLSKPIIWGLPSKNPISLFDKFNIPKNKKIILHASTPKTYQSRRFVLYETTQEYLESIATIGRIIHDMPDHVLIVKYRPYEDFNLEDLKNLDLNPKKVFFDKDIPFSDCLRDSSALISFSSTTIEEALQSQVPVIQFGPYFDFKFFPDNLPELSSANKYNLKEKIAGLHQSEAMNFSKFINSSVEI